MDPLRHIRNGKLLAGAALVGALLVAGFWPSAAPVDLAPAEKGPLRVTVDEEGETRVRDRFVVSAPVAGRVLRIELEPGDPVRRNELERSPFPSPSTWLIVGLSTLFGVTATCT